MSNPFLPPLTSMPPFNDPYGPLSDIQPFTVRDFNTFLKKLEGVIQWSIENFKVLDENQQKLVAAWIEQAEYLIQEVNTAIAQFEADATNPDGALIQGIVDSVESILTESAIVDLIVTNTLSTDTKDFKAPAGYPVFDEKNNVINIIDMINESGLPTIYGPSIVDARGIEDAPGNFLFYWSSDHHPTSGGIALAYADDIMGPWTIRPGVVYVDSVEGNQTETPCVLVRDDGTLIMYYQNRITDNNQFTYYATSPDGVTWTRGGRALDFVGSSFGNSHTGYANVYRIGTNKWVAYSLYGGTDAGQRAIWYSRDGINWSLDRRLFKGLVDYYGSETLRVPFGPILFNWRGSLYGLQAASTPASGGGTPAVTERFIAKVRDDLRGFVTEPETYYAANGVIEIDGVLYIYTLENNGLNIRKEVV